MTKTYPFDDFYKEIVSDSKHRIEDIFTPYFMEKTSNKIVEPENNIYMEPRVEKEFLNIIDNVES